jgi:hypothetical protein
MLLMHHTLSSVGGLLWRSCLPWCGSLAVLHSVSCAQTEVCLWLSMHACSLSPCMQGPSRETGWLTYYTPARDVEGVATREQTHAVWICPPTPSRAWLPALENCTVVVPLWLLGTTCLADARLLFVHCAWAACIVAFLSVPGHHWLGLICRACVPKHKSERLVDLQCWLPQLQAMCGRCCFKQQAA